MIFGHKKLKDMTESEIRVAVQNTCDCGARGNALMWHPPTCAFSVAKPLLDALQAERARPGIGVAALVYGPKGLLVGLRKGKHGAGTWSVPGGHLERGENAPAAATRELLEETGIDAFRYDVMWLPDYTVFSDDLSWPRSYVTMYCVTEVDGAVEPVLKEPDKCAEWRWVKSRAEIPGPLFKPFEEFVATAERTGLWARLVGGAK